MLLRISPLQSTPPPLGKHSRNSVSPKHTLSPEVEESGIKIECSLLPPEIPKIRPMGKLGGYNKGISACGSAPARSRWAGWNPCKSRNTSGPKRVRGAAQASGKKGPRARTRRSESPPDFEQRLPVRPEGPGERSRRRQVGEVTWLVQRHEIDFGCFFSVIEA